MFIIILLTSLITILVSIISLVIYLVTVIVDESDDANSPDSLAIDNHNFVVTPINSPVQQHQHHQHHQPCESGQTDSCHKSTDFSGQECQETPLHAAVRRHKLQQVIRLLCQNAKIDARNENGETPLIVACKTSDVFACKLLLVFDADFSITDSVGLSARHYAAHNCHKHKNQQGAAHLILAMLNEMGAQRCYSHMQSTLSLSSLHSNRRLACTDGCSPNGDYNGSSYDRWPSSFKQESFYKRHLFEDIIQERGAQCQHKSKKSRLLCFDGGGLRGLIVCQILIEMEKYLKRPVMSYFDWVGGTSVGAFLACALSMGTPLKEMRKICFDVKDEVFSGTKPYNSKFIERVLKRTYGATTRMSDIKHKKLAVTTVIADRDPCQLRFFRNYPAPNRVLESFGFPPDTFNTMSGHSFVSRSRTSSNGPSSSGSGGGSNMSDSLDGNGNDHDSDNGGQLATNKRQQQQQQQQQEESLADYVIGEDEQDPIIWQAVRASAAAPFFFKPYGPYLDGGIISNNPTLDMLTEFYSYQKVRRFIRNRVSTADMAAIDANESDDSTRIEPPAELDLVLSLGTGRGRVIGKQAILDFGKLTSGFSTVFSPVELVRSIRAARELFKKLMHQSCQTEDHILDRAQAWCSSLNIPYFRINPPLASIFSIDDKRDEQLVNALWQTKLYMRSMREQLIELSELLY